MSSLTLSSASVDSATFHGDVQYLEALWRRMPIGDVDLPVIDIGEGEPLVFVPILEHLEFVYARQVQAFSQSRRVILYRRQENRTSFVGLAERAVELLRVLDSLGLEKVDLVGHGDAAMVLFEFALRYPERCRSLIIIAQAADYQIAPHPFIWLLHELFLRLPVEHFLPAWFLRRIVINYIVARRPSVGKLVPYPPGRGQAHAPTLHEWDAQTYRVGAGLAQLSRALEASATARDGPRLPRELIEEQFRKIALWPAVYKFSVIPIIHFFDVRSRLQRLTMPILLINRADDALAPEVKTRWLAQQLPNCAGYHVVAGGERFFMYARAEEVNQLMAAFLLLPSSLSPQE
jgi:pimeloyl-ACP methyl ester carboxylesterase